MIIVVSHKIRWSSSRRNIHTHTPMITTRDELQFSIKAIVFVYDLWVVKPAQQIASTFTSIFNCCLSLLVFIVDFQHQRWESSSFLHCHDEWVYFIIPIFAFLTCHWLLVFFGVDSQQSILLRTVILCQQCIDQLLWSFHDSLTYCNTALPILDYCI